MRIVYFTHSLLSCWNHGNAHFLRGVLRELKARGHDVSRIRTFGMSGCATAVMIDPATRNRIAGADPRRDCYAIAY